MSITNSGRRLDPKRPRNSNIPFFATADSFDSHPKPDVPSMDEKAMLPWLVQPGINSVEVYEAILQTTLNEETSLKIWVSKAGAVQCRRLQDYHWPSYISGVDYGAADEQDVSYVMLSRKESDAIWDWFQAHRLHPQPCYLLTPFDMPSMALTAVDDPHPERTEREALEELGLFRPTFPRSLLPFGVKPIATNMCDFARRIPGPDKPELHGTAVDAEVRERVEWITPFPAISPFPENAWKFGDTYFDIPSRPKV
ncbi:hypothetical protein F4821DRAFT_123770 [Hypoxylon rubiginosum]|uniref:Uncharacterized protein n=1 Tax=Hypoxylon rubiginosum TaxID=110542 RepID=A0ACC0D1S0_9PEZI|nr:hypothetical protein F4821DRAFT_123770 [Hypoxylon rubiginosum]